MISLTVGLFTTVYILIHRFLWPWHAEQYRSRDGNYVIFDYRLPRTIRPRDNGFRPPLTVAPEVAFQKRLTDGNNMFGSPRPLNEISNAYRAKVDLLSLSERLTIQEIINGKLQEQWGAAKSDMSPESQYLAIASQWRPEPDLRCGWYEDGDEPEKYEAISPEKTWTFVDCGCGIR